jgi:hypothetical protein
MAKLAIAPGTTDVSVLVKICDLSDANNAGKTGLAYNTSSLTCYYAREGVASAALSLVTMTVTGSHNDGGFVEVDATNMPGIYRLDLPDACCASGKRACVVTLKGAADMMQVDLEIDLANQGDAVRIGGQTQTGRDLGASVLLSSGTGTGQVNLSSGRVDSNLTYLAGSALNTASAQLGVNVVNAGGTAWGSGAITSGAFAAGAINAAAIAADAIGASELAADAVTEIANAVKALVVESNGSITLQQAVSLILAACSGVTSSGGTVLKDPSGTATRITATVDGSNNRTAMTVTPSS